MSDMYNFSRRGYTKEVFGEGNTIKLRGAAHPHCECKIRLYISRSWGFKFWWWGSHRPQVVTGQGREYSGGLQFG